MTSVHRLDTEPPLPVFVRPLPNVLPGIPWGELSVDQPDGFGTISEPDLPSPDLNDDRGYGFGV